MKTIIVALLISGCAFGQTPMPAACGPSGVEFKVAKDKSQHPTPSPASGKAVVYLLDEGFRGDVQQVASEVAGLSYWLTAIVTPACEG